MQEGMGVLSAKKQADLLKDKGNLYFRKEKLGAAIEAYTEAITLCPSVPLYWTNRALCERKRHEWEKVEADCRRALELDNHCVKAYYLLGLALVHYQQYEEAVKQLEKAMDLGRGAEGKNYMVEEIWQELAKARFVEWEAVSEVRERQQLDLKIHLANLLREDYDRKLGEAIVSIKAANDAKSNSGADGIRPPPQMEVDDLIRLNSDSRQGSGGNGGAEKESGLEGDQLFPIHTFSELERLYRSQSEPPSVVQEDEVGVEKTAAFDPLRQHKLSLRRNNSISIRRQKSERLSLPREESEKLEPPPAATREEPQTEAAAPPSEMVSYPDLAREMLQSEERAASTAAFAASFLSASARERTSKNSSASDSSEVAPEFHSIYDVFKVFKEFMKLHQNEAGQKLLRLSELYQRRSKVLEDVFDRAAAPDRVAEVPDHLCCKITMDIFRDPVISPSGITYERAAILEHIHKVGAFDPLTRAPLTALQIVPNLAIKEAVQAYLDQHGWAYGPC